MAITITTRIEDGEDLRDWAVNNGWCIDYIIERLDNSHRWQEAFDALDWSECDSETHMNDLIRFGLDDMGFFSDDEDEEESEGAEE